MILVIAVASGIWYGAICYLAYRIGDNWDALLDAVQASGRWIGIVAIALALAGAAFWYLHRRRRA